MVLALIADDAGEVLAPMCELVAKSGLSRRQVQRVLRQLEAAGEIQVKRSTGARGVHVYTVLNLPVQPAVGEKP